MFETIPSSFLQIGNETTGLVDSLDSMVVDFGGLDGSRIGNIGDKIDNETADFGGLVSDRIGNIGGKIGGIGDKIDNETADFGGLVVWLIKSPLPTTNLQNTSSNVKYV